MKKIIFISIIIIILCYFQYNFINKTNEDFTILQYNNPNKDIFENMMNQKLISIFTNINYNPENIKTSLSYYNIPLCIKNTYKLKNDIKSHLKIQDNYRNLILQINGTRKFYIFKNSDKHNLYFKNNKTTIDFWNQNLEINPKLNNSKYIEIILHENQMIHIPYKFIFCSEIIDINNPNNYIDINSESIFSYFLKN